MLGSPLSRQGDPRSSRRVVAGITIVDPGLVEGSCSMLPSPLGQAAPHSTVAPAVRVAHRLDCPLTPAPAFQARMALTRLAPSKEAPV